MRFRTVIGTGCCLAVLAFSAVSARGQLYSEDFDDGNAVSRWTANAGIGFADDGELSIQYPMDTNFDTSPFPDVDGVNDDFSGFAFDYSIHGIPPAPNSDDPNTTIGLKLQSNNFSSRLGGFSASPNGLNLTGDYSITFDYWGMANGAPFPFTNSSTVRSTFGLLTAGTTSQSILEADGVFFGVVVDGDGPSGYTVYSNARTYSHQCAVSQFDPCDPNWSDPIDLQATYYASTRDSKLDPLYRLATGTDPNDPNPTRTAPQSVIDAGATFGADLTGPIWPGAAAMAWNEVEIRKVGNIIDFHMGGYKLMTMNVTDWFDPNTPAGDPNGLGEPPYPNGTITPGGGNISFGQTDTNFASPVTQLDIDFTYTLIDNIKVTAIVAAEDADFDGDGFVTGADFLILQSNIGLGGQTDNSNGDANGDGVVGSADLAVWEGQYGGPPPLSAIAVVPEPATMISWFTWALFSLFGYRPCRRAVR